MGRIRLEGEKFMFSPPDHIMDLEKHLMAGLQDTQYADSLTRAIERNSGVRIKARLALLYILPPHDMIMEDYHSDAGRLCRTCDTNQYYCRENFIPDFEGKRLNIRRKKKAENCGRRIDVDENVSICPKPLLEINWGRWYLTWNIFDAKYAQNNIGKILVDNAVEYVKENFPFMK